VVKSLAFPPPSIFVPRTWPPRFTCSLSLVLFFFHIPFVKFLWGFLRFLVSSPPLRPWIEHSTSEKLWGARSVCLKKLRLSWFQFPLCMGATPWDSEYLNFLPRFPTTGFFLRHLSPPHRCWRWISPPRLIMRLGSVFSRFEFLWVSVTA